MNTLKLIEIVEKADKDYALALVPADTLKKFAELIVRECGQYLNSPEFIGRSDLDWAMVLNEHFGVK